MEKITIGKGESITVVFKITDIDSLFVDTDKLLFAVKQNPQDTSFVFSYEKAISELDALQNDNNETVYTFSVQIKTEDSREISIGNFYYDITLIDVNGEEKPLFPPSRLEITKTIGASLAKEGEA